jgi:protein-disulfide isomerase
MSSRNSQANKQAARERLRAEREKEAKRSKVRRQLMVGGGVVALLAIAAGVAVAVSALSKDGKADDYWSTAAKKTLVKPANTSGDNGTTVIIGDANNKNTLDDYEDMRCPVCATYEQTAGDEVLQGAKDGKYKISFTFGTFLDPKTGGQGSRRALSALGASLNVSTEAFEQYHALLFSKDVHPEENKDEFGDPQHLIDLAQKVPALKGNKKFSDAVTKGTFDKWALAMSDKFDKTTGVKGTPTVKLNGKDVQVIGVDAATLMTTIEAGLTK